MYLRTYVRTYVTSRELTEGIVDIYIHTYVYVLRLEMTYVLSSLITLKIDTSFVVISATRNSEIFTYISLFIIRRILTISFFPTFSLFLSFHLFIYSSLSLLITSLSLIVTKEIDLLVMLYKHTNDFLYTFIDVCTCIYITGTFIRLVEFLEIEKYKIV